MADILSFPIQRIKRTFNVSHTNTRINRKFYPELEFNYVFNEKYNREYKKGSVIEILGTGYKDKRYKITKIFKFKQWVFMEGVHLGSLTGKHKCNRMIGDLEDISFVKVD